MRRPARRAPEARRLLAQPARAAARAVARHRLERALEKAAPFVVPADADAAGTIGNDDVHAFRVALRRLRSWVRAAGGLLHDDLTRRRRNALRQFARSAGAARDAQVEWAWLTSPAEPFSAPAARAGHWLAAERLKDYAAARDKLQRRAAGRWAALAASVAEALSHEGDDPDGGTPATGDNGPETLGAHLAPVLAEHLATAQAALERIEHRTQVKVIHRARIEVKRLRYLVEAVDAQSRSGARALRQLRALQDTLGELHDAHVIREQLEPLLVPHRGRPRPPGRPALRDLRALRAAVRRRELAAFRRAVDLLGSPAAAAAWRVLNRLPARAAAAGAHRTRRALRKRRAHRESPRAGRAARAGSAASDGSAGRLQTDA